MPAMRYPFVLLDVGETILAPRRSFGAVYADILGGLGIELPVEALDGALRTTWEEMERLVPRGADRYGHVSEGEEGYWRRFVRSTLEKLDGDLALDDVSSRALPRLRDAFARPEAWRVYPVVSGVIERLRSDGACVAVVSNWDSRLPALLRALALDGLLDAVVVSALEGREKPDPGLFRIALERLGGEPHDAIHVGDVPALDVEGARAAGIRGILVDRARRYPADADVIPDLSPLPAIARGDAGRA